jgi:hypothetical protein
VTPPPSLHPSFPPLLFILNFIKKTTLNEQAKTSNGKERFLLKKNHCRKKSKKREKKRKKEVLSHSKKWPELFGLKIFEVFLLYSKGQH